MEVDVRGTLDGAHEALNSLFLLHSLFRDEARVWYHFHHRAFSEAVCPIVLPPYVTLQCEQLLIRAFVAHHSRTGKKPKR